MRRWLSLLAKRIFWIALSALWLRSCVVELVRVTDSTMAPQAMPGDLLVVSKLSYGVRIPGIGAYPLRWHPIEKNDLVILTDVGEPPQTILRKIISLPKESITFPGRMEPQQAGANEYFVLAAAEERAPDSRNFGAVPLRSIVGQAKYIWRTGTSKVESLP